MAGATVELLQTAPPDAFEAMSVEAARGWCVDLIRRSSPYGSAVLDLAPPSVEADLAAALAVIAVHRDPPRAEAASDDPAAEETTDEPVVEPDTPDWRRAEREALAAGETPRHPAFVALGAALAVDPPLPLLDALIDGRIDASNTAPIPATWAETEARDRRRWGAAVRLVLAVLAPGVDLAGSADAPGAAGLAIAWTDACLHFGRRAAEHGRAPVPAEAFGELDPAAFLDRAAKAFRQGFAPDRSLLEESRVIIRDAVGRTWKHLEASEPLLARLPQSARPAAWFALNASGEILHAIERWNFETVIHEPRLSRLAWWRLRRGAARAGR